MDNELRGALFKNDRKVEDRHPDYKGEVTVNGRKYDVGAWLKKSKAGTTYMSLSLSIPRDAQQAAPVKHAPVLAGDMQDMDDSIPF